MTAVTLALFVSVALDAPRASTAHQADPVPPPNPGTTGAPAVIVKMVDSAFVPDAITLRIGQQVKFSNQDQMGHTVRASDGSFDSGYLAKGESWSTSFDVARTVMFADIYHPSMHGQITVVVN